MSLIILISTLALAWYCLYKGGIKGGGRQILGSIQSNNLVLALVFAGIFGALAFPGLLENSVVAGVFGTLAGFAFGQSKSSSQDDERSRRNPDEDD